MTTRHVYRYVTVPYRYEWHGEVRYSFISQWQLVEVPAEANTS